MPTIKTADQQEVNPNDVRLQISTEIDHLIELLDIQQKKVAKTEKEINRDWKALNGKITHNQSKRSDITDILIPKLRHEI